MLALRLRWALRDARARWMQVLGIALMISVGIGASVAMGSLTEWRRASNEAGLESTNMYDLRVRVGSDALVPRGALNDAVRSIDGVDETEERLVFETLVDVTIDGQSALMAGRIVGVDLTGGGPSVNRVVPVAGRGLDESEIGTNVVVAEHGFASFHELPSSGELLVGGGFSVQYVGQAVSPEYFLLAEDGGAFSRSSLLAMFTSIETAQQIFGHSGSVNDLVLTVAPGSDAARVREEVAAAVDERLPGIHPEILEPGDDESYTTLVNAPEVDSQIFSVISLLVFAGAAFAALNFATRMVEAQRREVGAAMAIGQKPGSIAVRPLMVGVQIGGLGVILGLVFGSLMGRAVVPVYEDAVALPEFVTPFQTGIFMRMAIIGFLVPVAAVLWPVLRATRVRPVEAIRTGHLATRGGGLSPVISRIPLPGSSLGHMPFRNLVRAPRRTFLTLLALTGVLAILFGTLGLRDSMAEMIDQGEQELLGDDPDRLIVRLDSLYPINSPQVTGVLAGGALRDAEPALTIAGTVRSSAGGSADPADDGSDELELALQFVDFDSSIWTPTPVEGRLSVAGPGIVLARKAADDLQVTVGDDVVVTHTVRTGPSSFASGVSTLEVIAIHAHPLRALSYLHIGHAAMWGFEGLASSVTGAPVAGDTISDTRRALFGTDGVALVQSLGDKFETAKNSLEALSGVALMSELAMLGLALLIAVNTANLNAEERAKDHATMFAFGVPVRRAVFNLCVEGLMLGIASILLSALFGYALLRWMVTVVFRDAFPDVGIPVAFDAARVSVFLIVGGLLVALAPMFSGRKLKRMNIPARLRVME